MDQGSFVYRPRNNAYVSMGVSQPGFSHVTFNASMPHPRPASTNVAILV